MTLKFKALTWDKPNNAAGLNLLVGSQPFPLHK
jgi:hypothetical protein